MAQQPIINQNFAGVDFNANIIYGDAPVTQQYLLDALPDPETQVYQPGTLLAEGSDGAHMVIYDSTDIAQLFKGVFFDELYNPDMVAQELFVNVAINDRPSTLWRYDSLIGANGGTTDIDALITAGYANVVNRPEGNQIIKLVQFKGMGVGA